MADRLLGGFAVDVEGWSSSQFIKEGVDVREFLS